MGRGYLASGGRHIVVEGVEYLHAEGFMMAAKARLFGDATTLEKILEAANPAVAKQLGRQVTDFDEELWVARRYDVVVEGNLAKFSQNRLLARYLLSTAPRVLGGG